MASTASVRCASGASTTVPAITVTTSTRHDAGSRRRARRAQKPRSDKRPGRRQLAEHQTGDQEARQHEEDVDARRSRPAPHSSRRWNSTTTTTATRPHPLDVRAELVAGDAVQLLAHGAPPADVGRHPIAQVDSSERGMLPGGTSARRSRHPPRGRVDLYRPPRHPATLLVVRQLFGGRRHRRRRSTPGTYTGTNRRRRANLGGIPRPSSPVRPMQIRWDRPSRTGRYGDGRTIRGWLRRFRCLTLVTAVKWDLDRVGPGGVRAEPVLVTPSWAFRPQPGSLGQFGWNCARDFVPGR